MKTKHTPGPWNIQFSSGNNGRAEYVHRLQSGVTIIQHLNGTTEESIHANAHLIAAAPELLEALERVVAIADRNTVEFNAAKAAIAKAKGEQL